MFYFKKFGSSNMESVWKSQNDNESSNLNHERRERVIVKEAVSLRPENELSSDSFLSENIKKVENKDTCYQVF